MGGIGSGEYDPIDIAGLLVDVMVLILTGIKGQGSTVGQILAIVVVLAMLTVLVSSFGLVITAFMGAIYIFIRKSKGKHGKLE